MRAGARRALTAFAVAAAAASPPARAAPGATSASFLRVDAGARAAALSGAVTGSCGGAESAAYNPAGLSCLERPEASFTHNQYLPGVRQEWMAAAAPTRLGTLAATANLLAVAPFSAYGPDDQPQGKVSAQDAAYGAAWGREVGGGVSLGLGAQVLRSRLAERSAQTELFDAGAHWRVSRLLEAGVAVLHLGRGLGYDGSAPPPPRTIALGAALHPLATLAEDHPETGWAIGRVSVLAQVSRARDQPAQVAGGLEFAYGDALVLRAGGRSGGWSGPGYTLGVGVDLFRRMRHRPEIEFDYAFVDYGELGIAQRAGLTVRFGRKTERAAHEARWRLRWRKKKKRPQWRQKKVEPIFFGPS